MEKPIELKEVLEVKEKHSKPRASSTSDIETQPSASTPKRPKSRIQFKLPGEMTPLMNEQEKSHEVENGDTKSTESNSKKPTVAGAEVVPVTNTEMTVVLSSHFERQTSEEEEEILEVLRRVVRSCTDADLSKRPSANEILDMLTKYLDQDDPLE